MFRIASQDLVQDCHKPFDFAGRQHMIRNFRKNPDRIFGVVFFQIQVSDIKETGIA